MRKQTVLSEAENAALSHQTAQRQTRLLDYLRSNLFVDIQLLQEKFGVSISTIRRDLASLEQRKLLRRTHGGAVSINQVTHDSEAAVRQMICVDEKQRIGAAAAALVEPGDTVMIDSGTTSLQVAKCLAKNTSLTFVTNGQDVLSLLYAEGARKIHVIGGEYVGINHSFSGSMAAEMVRAFNVDKAFLSVTSVDVQRSLICTLNPPIACVQQAMIDVAQIVVVVADHTKFERTALSVIAPLERIDYVVTDALTRPLIAALPEKLKKKFMFA